MDDVADACIFAIENYNDLEPINLGGESDLSIKDVAMKIKEVIGYSGELRFDRTKPDGMPVKLLDSSKLKKLGWKPKTDFQSSLKITYQWFLKNILISARGESS